MLKQLISSPEPVSPDTKPKVFYGYVIVISAFFIMVATFGAYYAFGVFFKPVLVEFGWSRAMTSGAFSLSMIVQGLLSIVMGGLNDRFGSKMVMLLSGFILFLGYLLMSQISSVWQLYLFYGVVIGTGMAGIWIPLLSTVARWFVRKRSTMSGIVLAGTGVGAFVAPPVANLFISYWGWRLSFAIMGCVLLVVVFFAARYLKRDPAQIGYLPYGVGGKDENRSRSFAIGIRLKKAICMRQFWQFFAMLFCFGSGFFVIMVHAVPHADELGFDPAEAATILSVVGVMIIAGRLVLSSIADVLGDKQIFIIGSILMAIGLSSLFFTRELWTIYLFTGIIGFATGGMGASESPFIARLFGLGSHGLIYGFVSLGYSIGASIGPLLAGYIFDVNGSYELAFIICGALSAVGLILTISLKPIASKQI